MIQRRPTTSSKISIIIVAVVLCFMAWTTIKDLQYMRYRKETQGRVISYNAPDPKHPATYQVETRFFNEYKHDSLDVLFRNYTESIPSHITVYYGKNEVYTDQQQITWGTVLWRSLVCLLLLSYIALELTTFSIANGKKN